MKDEGKTGSDHSGNTLAANVSSAIRKFGLLSGGESVIVGLSGGPDSVCLLHVLRSLSVELDLKLHAVYVNHNLRPDEVAAEEAFCRKRCAELDVSFSVKSIDVAGYAATSGLNIHEAARELRYRAFEEAVLETGAARIALGHNADDQLETFFMRLLRGTGPAGLAGIPAKRGRIVRPLIETCRADIERFLETGGITFVTDSSNLSQDYFRNRVRQQLMPVVRELNPEAAATMLHAIAILRDEERYFDVTVTKTLMRMISRKTDARIELFMAPMETLDPVILRRLLRRVIAEVKGLRGIGMVHIEDIMRLIRSGDSGDRLDLPGGVRVIREYALLVMTTEPPKRLDTYELTPPAKLSLPEAGLVLTATIDELAAGDGDGRRSVVLDADLMQFPLVVRRRREGDYLFPFGFGKKRKLQDLFVDAKVARDDRDCVPLVVSGDDIVWVAGYRADDRYRVTGKTKRYLRLGIVKGNF